MTLSRISPEKGIHLLLEALRLLETDGRLAGKDVRLFICGEPAFMMGQSYHKKVKAAAAKLKQVKVSSRAISTPRPSGPICACRNVFVSPSIHESYGLNVVEAMHAGLPMLASDHYGVRDTLPPEAGRLVHYPTPKKAPPLLAAAPAGADAATARNWRRWARPPARRPRRCRFPRRRRPCASRRWGCSHEGTGCASG